MPDSPSTAGDADSSSGLMTALKNMLKIGNGDRSLRAQLEDAIDEHEDGNCDAAPS